MLKTVITLSILWIVGYVALFNAVICPNYNHLAQKLVFPINLHDYKDSYLAYIGAINNYFHHQDPYTEHQQPPPPPQKSHEDVDANDNLITIDFTRINKIVNTDPIFKYNCQYLSDHNNKFLRDLKFNYKIYIHTNVLYYYHFYYPLVKASCTTTLGHLGAKLKYYYAVITLKLTHYCELNATLNRVFNIVSHQHFNEHIDFLKEEINNRVGSTFSRDKLRFDYKKLYNSYIRSHKNLEDVAADAAVKMAETDESDYTEEYYDDDESDGPLTIKLTSTIYERMSSSTPDESGIIKDGGDVYTEDEWQVIKILNDFDQRINNTIDIALASISHDINPIINKTIEEVQTDLTEIFKSIQNKNYQYYKDCNTLISQIDKDLSKIKSTNKTIETVSRQDMRDLIDEIREFNGNESERVVAIVNDHFEMLVNTYLLIIQNTINILESFIDSSFQNFEFTLSNKMSQLSLLNEFTWNSWKHFHDLKTFILDNRDSIYDQANYLKTKKFDELSLDNDFKNWLSFLNTVDHHLTFLSRDNSEYLQLIRAKANISYQLREEVVSSLETSRSTADKPEPASSSTSSSSSTLSDDTDADDIEVDKDIDKEVDSDIDQDTDQDTDQDIDQDIDKDVDYDPEDSST